MENRVFFPQAALDRWIVEGSAELQNGELMILPEGRRYKVAEAVHVLREVSGSGDTYELVGRAKAVPYVEQLGAEIVETSMLIGDAAYDVEPGWVGVPMGSFADHVGSVARKKALSTVGFSDGPDPKTDEDLLGRFLAKHP
jgi:hypothetical protein